MKQADLGLSLTTKRTRKREFLDEMNRVVPWAELVALVSPFAPDGKKGRPPFSVATMLRIHFMQQWFGLSDQVPLYREFAGLDNWTTRLPDESTILRFRHLLEKHKLAAQMLLLINDMLRDKGLMLRAGTVVDATLIVAPSSTKNASGTRDPEMHQTKKGNQWYFGMKAHIGADAESGLVHTVRGTAANVNDVVEANSLLHGDETDAFGDAGYQGAHKRADAQPGVNWHVAMRPGKRAALDKSSPMGAMVDEVERIKVSIRAKAAMAEAVKLLAGGPQPLYVLGFGALCIGTQIYFSYERTVRVLKWLTLALFAYVAVILSVSVPWKQAIAESFRPWAFMPADVSVKDYAAMVVAVLGTTISPYLFFWQASHEVEDGCRRPGSAELRAHPAYVAEHLSRIKQDTFIGMTFSNVIALSIVIATAVTLNAHGVTNIQTSAQAAEALRPVAGDFAFGVFALGIVGTGLLAVPVLAGSAAFAVSEVFGWKAGFSKGFHEARGFYLIIIAATGIGSAMGFFDVDPIEALVWSAIVNGVISMPIMVVVMMIGQSKKLMGKFTISGRHRFFGWLATLVMGAAAAFMLATSF